MPKLGVDMQEGEIIEWKKQEGDVVNEGDILLEIMSDKTNMELEAEDSGVLLKITDVYKRQRGGDPLVKALFDSISNVFPAHAGVILYQLVG